MKMPSFLLAAQVRWRALAPREQSMLAAAAWLVGLALAWWLLMLPPLRTLGQADAQRKNLDAQLQKMQALEAQARALQNQPKLSREEALRALDASVKQRLGATAQLNVIGDRATVTLRNIPADTLAQWLTQARINARAIPSEARLVRASASAAPATGAGAAPGAAPRGFGGVAAPPAAAQAPEAGNRPVAWDGTLVMSLPAQ